MVSVKKSIDGFQALECQGIKQQHIPNALYIAIATIYEFLAEAD
jgi:type III secretion system FlhB-like substrate exporter